MNDVDFFNKPKIYRINVAKPRLGGKAFVVDDKGIFILDEGPCLLRVIALTYAGTGILMAIDGVPNDDGFFPDENMSPDDPKYNMRNGKILFKSHPVALGSFALDIGAQYGLTIVGLGGHQQVNSIATIVWLSLKDNQ